MSKVYTIVIKGQRFDFTQADLDAIKKGEVNTETQKRIVHVFTGKGRVDVDQKEFNDEIKKGVLASMSPEELEELEASLPSETKEAVESTAEQVLDKPVEDNVNPQTDQEMVSQGQAEHPGEQIATTNAGDPQERKPEDEEAEEVEEAEENGEVIEEPQDESAEDEPKAEIGEEAEEEPQEDVEEPVETPEEAKPLQVVCPHCKGQVDTSVEPGGVPEAPVEAEETQVPGPLRQPGEPVEPTFGLPAMKGVSVSKVSSDGSLQKIWCDDPEGHMEIINKAEQGSKRRTAGRIAGAVAGVGAVAALAHPATRRAGIKRLRSLGGKIKTGIGRAIGAGKKAIKDQTKNVSSLDNNIQKDFSIAEIIDMLEFAPPTEQQELIKYLIPEELNDIMELFDKVDEIEDMQKYLYDLQDTEKGIASAASRAYRGIKSIPGRIGAARTAVRSLPAEGRIASRGGQTSVRANVARTYQGLPKRGLPEITNRVEQAYHTRSLRASGLRGPVTSPRVIVDRPSGQSLRRGMTDGDIEKYLNHIEEVEKGIGALLSGVLGIGRKIGGKLISGIRAAGKTKTAQGVRSGAQRFGRTRAGRAARIGIPVAEGGLLAHSLGAFGKPKKSYKAISITDVKKKLDNLNKGIARSTIRGVRYVRGSANELNAARRRARAAGRKIRSVVSQSRIGRAISETARDPGRAASVGLGTGLGVGYQYGRSKSKKSMHRRKKRKKVMELQNIKKELKNLEKRRGWNGISTTRNIPFKEDNLKKNPGYSVSRSSVVPGTAG